MPSIDFRTKILPVSPSQMDTDEYMTVEIDQAAPEHNEPLVALSRYGVRANAFYSKLDGLNQPVGRAFPSGLKRVYVRLSVARKLKKVNSLLKPYGVRVVVWDGFRPISVQHDLWNWMIEHARYLFPDQDDEHWTTFALRYASNPNNFRVDDSTTWPTHSTGGAVDLSLEEISTGHPVYMGGIYLDSSSVSSTRYYENADTLGSETHKEACRNRRLLFWAMTSVGFVNYPFEWWHFDYRTQASIMYLGMPQGAKAHYGLANEGLSPEL